MTIQPMNECPNPLNGVYNPTPEMAYAEGYRLVPPLPEVPDGFTETSCVLGDGDGVMGAWIQTVRPTAEITAEQYDADLAANGTRYALQNNYMTLCGQLTGQAPCKLGFAELQKIITTMKATDPATAMGLALQLLTLNAALVREGGVQWWDNCEWKELP